MRSFKLAVFASHPIQYLVPVLRAIAARPEVRLTVYYGSRHGLQTAWDPGFERAFAWDLPLLDGYESTFLTKRVGKPTKFLGLRARTIGRLWVAGEYDAHLVVGWYTLAHWQALHAAGRSDGALIIRGESNLRIQPENGLWRLLRPAIWLPLRRVVYGWCFRKADAFLTIGAENDEYYQALGIEPARLFHAPYCVDNQFFSVTGSQRSKARAEIRRWLSLDDDSVILLAAGRLIPRKGFDDLVHAAANVLPHNIGAHLLIAGDGPERGRLTSLVQAAGLDDRVTFCGFVNQGRLAQLYAGADAFVMPSRWETWGLSANEAMAAGLPVIASDGVPAAHELLCDAGAGWTFRAGDPASLAADMERLLRLTPEQRRQMGDVARSRVASYSPERVADTLVDVLRQVVERRGR